ncbi:MAG: MFS transporter [Caldilineaceae bacterium]
MKQVSGNARQSITQSLHTLLLPLASPGYRRLLLSSALWQQALAMWMLVAGWLLLDLTDSAFLVAMLSFWRRGAQLLVGFFAGPIGDRLGRRQTMLLMQWLNLGAFGTVAVLFWLNWLLPWHMLAAMFGIGIAWTIELPARVALTPDLVGKAQTADAMVLENFMQGLLGGVGPLVAGWLLARYGPLGGFMVLLLITLVHLVLLFDFARIAIPHQVAVTQGTLWQAIGQGVRYIGGHRLLLGVTLISAVLNILIFPSVSLLPVFARDVLERGPVGLGLLSAGHSIGTFAGLFLVHQIRGRMPINRIFILGALLECCALTVFALSPVYALSWLMLFCTGMGQAGFHTMRSVILLTEASDEMRGRAMSTIVLTQGAGLPGELQTGLLAERIGAPLTVGLQAGAAALLTGLITAALPALRHARADKVVPVG